MSALVLALNAGAASLRFSVFRAEGALLFPLLRGAAQELGERPQLSVEDPGGASAHVSRWAAGETPDYIEAFERVLFWLRQRGYAGDRRRRPPLRARRRGL